MDNGKNIKFSSHLVLTATLSGSITVVLSLVYTLLSIVAIVIRFGNCNSGIHQNGAEYFWKTIVSAYFLGDECPSAISAGSGENITSAYTVYVLAAITLSVSVLCLVTASILIASVQDEGSTRYLNVIVSTYIGSCIAALVVDLTTATHFGIDHSYLTSKMESSEILNYKQDVLRHGAFLLMTIAMKGYVAHLVNLILLILLVVYALEHRKLLIRNEHSIHTLGVIAAYDHPRKTEDNNWATQPEVFSPFARGPQVNNGFINDDESDRGNRRQPSRNDYNHSNQSYDRSDSWHRTQPNLAQSSRPFSYLEDIKRSGPTRPPPSPAVEAPWQREPWSPGPPVPMPDYSPPRRLKSALKPGYM